MFNSLLSLGPYKVPTGSTGSLDRILERDSNFSVKRTKTHTTSVMIYAGGFKSPARYLYHRAEKIDKKWGVAIPTISDKRTLGAIRIVKPSEGVSNRLKVAFFNSRQEAENAKKFLESNLISFLIRTTKHANTVNTNKNSFSKIPLIDFTKNPTDSKLLKLFNITKEEKRFFKEA